MSLLDKLKPKKKSNKNPTIAAGAVGIASLIWAGIKIKRELYGPGGTKLSRHNPSIDKVWSEKDRPAK